MKFFFLIALATVGLTGHAELSLDEKNHIVQEILKGNTSVLDSLDYVELPTNGTAICGQPSAACTRDEDCCSKACIPNMNSAFGRCD